MILRPVLRPVLRPPLRRVTDAGGVGGGVTYNLADTSPDYWYDPSDLSTLWQNTGKTTPAGVGDPVRVIADKSGNGKDWIAPSDAARPIVTLDAFGNPYLAVDGSDDLFTTGQTESFAAPFTMAFCIAYPQTFVTQLRGFMVYAFNGTNYFESGARSDLNEIGLALARADNTSGGTINGSYGVDSYPAGVTPSVIISDLSGSTVGWQRNGLTRQTTAGSGTYGPVASAYLGLGYRGSGTPLASTTPLSFYGSAAWKRDLTSEDRTIITGFYRQKGTIPESGIGAAIGDSNVGNYTGGITTVPSHIAGFTSTTIATSGDRIANQKTKWEALNSGLVATFRSVFVQVGLNDCKSLVGENLATASDVISAYQDLVDTVRGDVSAGCKVYACVLTPCREWLETATNGAAAYAAWQAINEAIMGGGATPITGVDARLNGYDADLNDGNGYLVDAYNIGGAGGDGVHLTDAGRALVSGYWRVQLVSDGLVP